MTEHLEIVTFTVRPEAREAFLAGRPAAIGAIAGRFPAFVDARLAEGEDGVWTDIVRWRNLEDAQAAAQSFPEIPEAAAWAAHIAEVRELRHAAIRHVAP